MKKEPKDLIGKKCYEVIHCANKPWRNCPNKSTLSTKKMMTEEIIDPNLDIPFLVTTSPIFDDNGKPAGTVHIAKDISKQKKAQEELRKRAEDLEKFNSFAIGRELKMVELKNRIKELEGKLSSMKRCK